MLAVRFEFCAEAKVGKSKASTPPTLWSATKDFLKLVKLHLLLTLLFSNKSLTLFDYFPYAHIALIPHVRCSKHYLRRYFSVSFLLFFYQRQALKLMRLWKVCKIIPNWFSWLNGPWNVDFNTTLPKKASLVWCQFWRGPSQDVHFSLIIWYVKIIFPTL